MKFSLSHIAWSPEEDTAVATLMQQYGITGVDLTPSKLFADPFTVSDAEIATVQKFWSDNGITIAGAQSLHYGFPDLQLFGTTEQQQAFVAHTKAMITLLGRLGATRIVFGSPKNRVKGELSLAQAIATATPLLRDLAETAVQAGTVLCIEPNATAYGCDFVTNTAEGIQLVQAVDHAGFGLHLDTGTMILMQENPATAIASAKPYLRHFHVAEPMLEPVSKASENIPLHKAAAKALQDIGYTGWVTVEMKDGSTNPNTLAVEHAAAFVTAIYS